MAQRPLQPWGASLFRGIAKAHKQFIAKTVMVKDNDVDFSFRLLNRLMAREGLLDIIRRTERFEKPYMQRNRLAFEQNKAIYNEEMDRKIAFLTRKNRKDPYPGQ